MVSHGTGVPVVAVTVVVDGVEAAEVSAAVCGTWVAVIALQRGAAHTLATTACVGSGAGVAVVTWSGQGYVGAPRLWCAAVESADFVIVAVKHSATGTLPGLALVLYRAGIAIGAGRRIGVVDTADIRIAEVIGALVSIVAAKLVAAYATALIALVVYSADITIIAGCEVGCMRAAKLRVAAIISTEIPIVAIGGHATCANAILATLPDRAGVCVVTGKAFVCRHHATFPRIRVTCR